RLVTEHTASLRSDMERAWERETALSGETSALRERVASIAEAVARGGSREGERAAQAAQRERVERLEAELGGRIQAVEEGVQREESAREAHREGERQALLQSREALLQTVAEAEASLKTKVEQVQRDLQTHADQERERAGQERQRLQGEWAEQLSSVDRRVADMECEREALGGVVHKIQAQASTAQDSVTRLRQRVLAAETSLDTAVDTYRRETAREKETVASLTQRLDAVEREREAERERDTALEVRCSTLEATLASVVSGVDSVASLGERVSAHAALTVTLSDTCQAVSARVSAVEDTGRDLGQRLDTLDGQTTPLAASLEQCMASLSALSMEIQGVGARQGETDRQVQEMSLSVAGVCEGVSACSDLANTVQQGLASLTQQVERVERESVIPVHEARQRLGTALVDVGSRAAGAVAAVKEGERQVAVLSESVSAMQSRIAALADAVPEDLSLSLSALGERERDLRLRTEGCEAGVQKCRSGIAQALQRVSAYLASLEEGVARATQRAESAIAMCTEDSA
ncbi:hypothetical protein KIPB_003729, partial [Kipferlia bialata]